MAGYYGNIKRKLLRDTMSEVTGIIRIRKFRKMYITMPEYLYITKKKKNEPARDIIKRNLKQMKKATTKNIKKKEGRLLKSI